MKTSAKYFGLGVGL